jgi:hypothetical protein
MSARRRVLVWLAVAIAVLLGLLLLVRLVPPRLVLNASRSQPVWRTPIGATIRDGYIWLSGACEDPQDEQIGATTDSWEWPMAFTGVSFTDPEEFRLYRCKHLSAAVRTDEAFFERFRTKFKIQDLPVSELSTIKPLSNAQAPCKFAPTAEFGAALGASFALHIAAPMRGLVAIDNADGTDACTVGDVVLAQRGVTFEFTHELGHLVGGLFDEGAGQTPRIPVDGPNCAEPDHLPERWQALGVTGVLGLDVAGACVQRLSDVGLEQALLSRLQRPVDESLDRNMRARNRRRHVHAVAHTDVA